jgi:hypothetical protein
MHLDKKRFGGAKSVEVTCWRYVEKWTYPCASVDTRGFLCRRDAYGL